MSQNGWVSMSHPPHPRSLLEDGGKAAFLIGATSRAMPALNAQALQRLAAIANVREHATTHELPQVRFERDERTILQPGLRGLTARLCSCPRGRPRPRRGLWRASRSSGDGSRPTRSSPRPGFVSAPQHTLGRESVATRYAVRGISGGGPPRRTGGSGMVVRHAPGRCVA
jgi:hypothetical protein